VVITIIGILISLMFAVGQLWAAEQPKPWLNPDPAAVKSWREMRFGMFIHWGPVSLTGREISLFARHGNSDRGVR